MPICPNKIMPEWKALIQGLKERNPKATDADIDAMAHLAFIRQGDGKIPVTEDAVRYLFKGKTKKLKEDLKEAFKAFKIGKQVAAKDITTAQKEFASRVSEYLKGSERIRGVLTDKQIAAIVRRANKIGASEKAFKRFTDYYERVVDDANYDANVADAKRLQKQLTNAFANAAPLINKMRRISPEDLTAKQLLKFNEIAQNFVDSKKPVGSANYRPFDVKSAEAEFVPIEESIKQKLISEVGEAYGIMDISAEDATLIEEFMAADNMNMYYENLDETRKTILRDKILSVANYSQLGLQEKLAIDKGLFEENYEKSDINKLELISKANLSRIGNVKQLAELTRFMDNATVNNSLADLTSAYTIIEANQEVPYLANLVAKSKLFKIGKAEQTLYDQPIILKRLFGLRSISGPFRSRTGIDDIGMAESRKEKILASIKNEWDAFRKQNNVSNSAESDMAVGVYADLTNVDPTDIDGSYNDIKKQMQQSIERYRSSEKEEDRIMGDYLSVIYDYAVKESNTRDEFITKFKEAYPQEAKVAEFAKSINDRYLDKLKRHAELDLNEEFKERLDYATGRSYKSIIKTEPAVDDFLKIAQDRDIRSPQETGRTKERMLKDKLPANKAVDYRFEYNFFKNLEKQIFVTESYEAARKFKYMTELDDFAKIVGGESNKQVVKDAFWDRYGMLAFGGKRADDLAGSMLVQSARIAKNIGSAYVLGRGTQIISQVTPIINTSFQAPKYTLDVLTTSLPKDLPLFEYRGISTRGLEKGAVGKAEGTQTFVYTKGKRGAAKVFNDWYQLSGKGRDIVLKPLVAADAFTARNSFLAYYLKYMNEIAKIPTTAKDLETEHLRIDKTRKDALSYAQQSVEETQAASDRSLLSRMKANFKGDATRELLMGVILPFNNFSSNTKARMIEDIRKVRYGNNEQKVEATLDLAGSITETAAFQAANIFIISGIIRYGLMSALAPMFGFENRKDFDEYMSGRVKTWYTNIMREIFASGFSQSVEDEIVNLVNYMSFKFKQMSDSEFDSDYYKWLREEATFQVPYQPKELQGGSLEAVLNRLGSYGIAPKAAIETFGASKAALTGNMTLTGGYIQPKEVPVELTEEQRWFYTMSALLKGTALVTGVSDADIIRAVDAIERGEESEMKKSGSGTRRRMTRE